MKRIEIRILNVEDADDLLSLTQSDDRSYKKYFSAFDEDISVISKILCEYDRDRYWGIWVGAELAGMFMLRGFDKGFEIPAYGVYVARKFSGCGLANTTLHYSMCWCKINGISELMLSVHKDNIVARGLYEANGFVFSGEFSSKGHWIYRKLLIRE